MRAQTTTMEHAYTTTRRGDLEPRLTTDRLPTPIGTAIIVVDEDGRLRAFDWDDHEGRQQRLLRTHYGSSVAVQPGAAPSALRQRIEAYFDGDCAHLDDIVCETAGTAFQRTVWAALRRIPVGQTTSYGALAASIGSPKASRAVGLANGANPIGVIVPCHRVIGANGSLTGYGGGMDRKRWLHDHEQKFITRTSRVSKNHGRL